MSEQIGGYPSMPGEPPRAPAAMGAPPSTVDNAVKLMFLRAALSLLGLLLLVVNRNDLENQIRAEDGGLSDNAVESAATVAVSVGVVLGVIFLGLYVLLAIQVRKGKSWARITTLVITALSVLATLSTLGQPQPGSSRILAFVTVLVDVGIVVLLLMRPSAEFFRRRP